MFLKFYILWSLSHQPLSKNETSTNQIWVCPRFIFPNALSRQSRFCPRIWWLSRTEIKFAYRPYANKPPIEILNPCTLSQSKHELHFQLNHIRIADESVISIFVTGCKLCLFVKLFLYASNDGICRVEQAQNSVRYWKSKQALEIWQKCATQMQNLPQRTKINLNLYRLSNLWLCIDCRVEIWCKNREFENSLGFVL